MSVKFSEFSIGTIGADLEIVGYDSATPTNVQVSYSDIKADILADAGEISSYATFAGFPATGVTNNLYIDLSTAYVYYWDGAAYVQVISPPSPAITSSVGLFNYYNFV
jgi:hypothetical protein